ncbi:hypothetical protein [Nocardioides panacihumi]
MSATTGVRPAVGGLFRLAFAAAASVTRAVTPVLMPVLAPLPRPFAPVAGALTSPLGRVAGDPRRPVIALRVEGRDQPVAPDVLARLARNDTGRVLVLVPTSGGDERTWLPGIEQTGATYGDRLAALLGWSPVTLRHDPWAYDAEAGVAGGALALAALLQRVVDGWPVPVIRMALIAAGDGGLLARSALGVRVPGSRPWTDLVSELVALGTPPLGTPVGAPRPGPGRRLEEELSGVVAVDAAVLDVSALEHVDYLLVEDRALAGTRPIGRALGTTLGITLGITLGGLLRWGRPARGVHDLFPTAERFAVATHRCPLANHPQVHDALLRRLA